MADNGYDFVAVTNIPSNFHAADLRAHFSSLVESNSFICFHFRHRPEKVSEDTQGNKRKDLKRCCVVKVLKTKLVQFLRYNGQHWTDVNGDLVVGECHVSQIKLKSSRADADVPETVEEETILQMPEFKPPELLLQGNVGTSTVVFLDLIQRCLLPNNLISKLQLKFPKTAARRIYANVNFDYKVSSDSLENAELVDKVNRHRNKYPGGSLSTTKTLYKHRPSSEPVERKGSLISDNCNYTHSQEIHSGPPFINQPVSDKPFIDQSVIDMDNSSSNLDHTSNSHVNGTEEYRPEKDSTDASLKPPISLISVTESYGSDCSKTKLTPGLSEIKLSQCPASETKFLVPVSLPIREKSKNQTNKERKLLEKEEKHRIKRLKAENIEEKLIAVERRYHNDEDAEEWDRHEASEDDPSSQERNKERLYEEEIEQPWEKGGPGVVFYTDAMFWQEKEGDFDEQTTDDLDVDFSAYEEQGAGDKDIKDFLRIRQERRFRDGYDETDRFSIGIGKRLREPTNKCSSRGSRIGAFECHSKGVGRKVMEKQGWKEGLGLGKSMPGIVNALKGEGQGPFNKRGLGYTDIKPVVYGSWMTKKTRSQPHLITTIYDDPKTTDPKEPLLQRSEPSTLKHRQSHIQQFS